MRVHTAHHAHKPHQSVFTHLENSNTCVRFLFTDFSSAFSTISPMRLIGTLWAWGPDWILDQITDPRRFELAVTPPPLWCWTPEPPRAVCSALICSRCTPISAISDSQIQNSSVMYADDTSIISRITHNNEGSYQEEIKSCWDDSVLLNINKTKELVVDFTNKGSKDTQPCLHQWSWGEQFYVPRTPHQRQESTELAVLPEEM